MSIYNYVFAFIEGFLTFISPCILPLLPVYFSYLAGSSYNQAVQKDSTGMRLIINSIGFVAGFTVIFVLLGAAATSVGYFLRSNIDIFRKISGIIMVVFGLNFIGILKLNFLNIEKRFEYNYKKYNFLNSMIFGIVFGFGWTPCLGAFLGSALLMAGNSETLLQGMLLLFVYSIGLGIPFVLTSIVFNNIKDALKAVQKHGRTISIISGVILVVVGILVFTDTIKYLSSIY